jgi:hypothetical protein
VKADHETIVRQTGEMIGKPAESFCAVFSAVYGENGLGGDCRAGGDGAGGDFLATSAFASIYPPLLPRVRLSNTH